MLACYHLLLKTWSTVSTWKKTKNVTPGVEENLRPAWTFDMTRIRIFVIQVRVQDRVKTKLYDKQVLRQ